MSASRLFYPLKADSAQQPRNVRFGANRCRVRGADLVEAARREGYSSNAGLMVARRRVVVPQFEICESTRSLGSREHKMGDIPTE